MKQKTLGKSGNATLFVLSLVMIVNALAYGTIIPLLYPYAQRYGLSPVGLSFLFASFSLAQFISTPIIGRMSDRWGRKPILLACLFGTGLSLAMFAAATSVPFLFISRIIDGITGGNMSVAQAMIADSTEGNERAKAFGILGATFGVGFLVGPAMGGLLSNITLAAPFWFSAVLACLSAILGMFVLPETLKKNQKVSKEPLFHVDALVKALFSPLTGSILLISFLVSMGQTAFFIGFQTFTVDTLHMTPFQTGFTFAMFGIINIIMQAVGLKYLLQAIPSKKRIIGYSLITSAFTMFALAFQFNLWHFIAIATLFGVVSSPIFTLLTGIISERTKGEDQGGILGINQSYVSIGQIVGPLLAGAVAARYGSNMSFVLTSVMLILALGAATQMNKPVKAKLDL